MPLISHKQRLVNFIQSDVNIVNSYPRFLIGCLKKVNKAALVKKLTVQQLKVEWLKACIN